jgi:nucleolar pre-ribosomal-associated protein 1
MKLTVLYRYWHNAGLTLESRLSSRWIANISIFGSIISLLAPESTFKMSESSYRPTPPPLSSIIENILPSVNIKNHFSKGLQSSAKGLVQHCTALALSKCLLKLRDVGNIFRTIMQSLEENEVEGQWSKRLTELTREARRRVPDFQVIVSFAHQQKGELLAESAMRLLWLYHECLPDLVSEAKFDVGKLLVNAFPIPSEDDEENDGGKEGGFRDVERLHVLRMLTCSDQFVWTGKPGGYTTCIDNYSADH